MSYFTVIDQNRLVSSINGQTKSNPLSPYFWRVALADVATRPIMHQLREVDKNIYNLVGFDKAFDCDIYARHDLLYRIESGFSRFMLNKHEIHTRACDYF